MSLIRSISGLRATLGDSLTPSAVISYVSAYAAYLPEGKIVVGRDGRPSGKWIESLVAGTLAACGRKVELIGMATTPTVQLAVEKSDAAGGIAITASHNPSEWNGLKFLNSQGIFLDEIENANFWAILDGKSYEYPKICGEVVTDLNAGKKHIDSILSSSIFSQESIQTIKDKKYKVVVDAVNASASKVIPELLAELGVETVELYCDASGEFPHTPEPLPQFLGDLAAAVKEHNADLGVAIDPDGDRLVLIDERGLAIGEEKTVALAIDAAMQGLTGQNAVVNLSTSNMAEYAAKKHGGKLFRSAVGEINVVKKMKATNSIVGGEGSGGVILPASHYGRDSLVGVSLVLSLMAKENKSLSEIVASYPKYEMIKTKYPFTGSVKEILNKVEAAFPQAAISREDGIRLDFEDSWAHLRASNTEPIIRIIAESPSEEKSLELIEKIKAFI